MAHLTKLKIYDITVSNIALLGSDLEKNVREHSGDKELAWQTAGSAPGLEIWRIEKFAVVAWPKDRIGSFYSGDSYIVLHTYKKTPESESLSYDIHFWLGEQTTQDEAGTAAYKTVELDDHLHGVPVQYREVQGFESERFLSYFPHFVCLNGGVSTGFHHVSEPLPLNIRKLYRITFSRSAGKTSLVVREVPADASSLVEGDVYVLDKGAKVLQFNTKASAGKEKFKAAEFVHTLANTRQGHCDVIVYDEGGSGAGVFLAEFGEHVAVLAAPESKPDRPLILFRLSDSTGKVTFDTVEPPTRSSLSSADAFLLDASHRADHPAIFVWIGKDASLTERRLSVQYAQNYLHHCQASGDVGVRLQIPIVVMKEGHESAAFLHAVGA